MRVATSLGRLLVALAAAGACAATAQAAYAPPGMPGPALSVPKAKLEASLACSRGFDHATRTPVLLVHGTGSSARYNWGWTYEPALNKLGIPWCTVDMPDHGNSDIQVSGEYIVYSIRTMYRRAGRRIAVAGHSQGGMVPRWALRYWPYTRAMVDDVIGFAASNHGTTLAGDTCSSSCLEANWQQRDDARFIAALNSPAETFPGISYTNIYSHTDEVVRPNDNDRGSSSLHGGGGQIANIATQDICPGDIQEHLGIGTVDPVAYAIALDALTHAGPADPERVSRGACTQLFQPGVDPVMFPLNAAAAAIDLETSTGKESASEPPLRCYVTATCRATQRLRVTPSRRTIAAATPTRVSFTVTVRTDGISQPVPDATIRIAGRRLVTGPQGTVTATLRAARAGSVRGTARAHGFLAGVVRITAR
jgi:pimeloyl-ACP methyl ester carboxylesterase